MARNNLTPMAGNMAQPQQMPPMTANNNQLNNGNMAQPAPMGGMTANNQFSSADKNNVSSTNVGIPQTTSMTPGGLQGNINPNRYSSPVGEMNMPTGSTTSPNRMPIGYGGSSNGGVQAGTQSSSVGDFNSYADSALAQAMRGLNPMIEQDQASFEQQMLNRGIQPGTEMYEKQKASMSRNHNDLLSQAQYGAQQQGLQAQQQAWGQEFGYDQLANALSQTNIGANASMYGADRGADASMANAQTGANASMYNAGLANMLGYAGLNEQGRQFDASDIFRTNQQDINAGLAWANHGLGQQGMDINAFNAQNNANNNWWNQIGGMTANAPGVMFNPTGNLAGSMQNAGQNMYGAQQAQNQSGASLAGGLLGISSDKRLKENIKYIETIGDVNVYEFDYIDKTLGKERYKGVMAQEVMIDYPNAVFADSTGYYKVDYNQLPIDMEIV